MCSFHCTVVGIYKGHGDKDTASCSSDQLHTLPGRQKKTPLPHDTEKEQSCFDVIVSHRCPPSPRVRLQQYGVEHFRYHVVTLQWFSTSPFTNAQNLARWCTSLNYAQSSLYFHLHKSQLVYSFGTNLFLNTCINHVFTARHKSLICVYTRTHTHTHDRKCMHAYMHTCMHTCIHTCMHACMHAYIHTCLLLISMLWHRQAIFESKGDKLSSSAENRIRTHQGLRHQIASRLNAHWQTDWAIENQAKNLNSTARPYDQRTFSPLDPTAV